MHVFCQCGLHIWHNSQVLHNDPIMGAHRCYLQGGMLSQDQDDDIPRLKSFSGPSTAAEQSYKASKQKKKRDPSPLSRMGSSLLRPFTKGLSKLRTSRSSNKDGKLQAQSRTASQSDSLASRATSVSTQDAGMPSRFNSVTIQTQGQAAKGGKGAPERSESFRFKSLATEAAPDLAAEPSFAQDLPHNSRLSQHNSAFQSKAITSVLSASQAATGTTAEATGDPPRLNSLGREQLVPSSDDDEFDYDFGQTGAWPSGGQRNTAPATTAPVPQLRTTSTSPVLLQTVNSKDNKASSAVDANTMSNTGSGDKPAQAAEIGGTDKSSSSFVEVGKFRPQLSRAERPQLAITTASVYSPLEVGAATSHHASSH